MRSKFFVAASLFCSLCSLFISTVVHAQEYDTAVVYADTVIADTAYSDDEYYSDEEEEEDLPIEGATFTISDPAQLPVTKHHESEQYAKHDFDKTQWKEIVGETSYTETREKEKPKESGEKDFSAAPVWTGAFIKTLGFAAVFILAIVVFYFLIKNTFADEGVSKISNNDEFLLFDNQHIEDVSEQDIESLLKKALEANDFRAAVRLYYIRLLKQLHGTNFISWKKDKTNRDYTYELSKTAFVADFQKITLAYEFIWYGERTPSIEEFKILQQNFEDIYNLTTTRS